MPAICKPMGLLLSGDEMNQYFIITKEHVREWNKLHKMFPAIFPFTPESFIGTRKEIVRTDDEIHNSKVGLHGD